MKLHKLCIEMFDLDKDAANKICEIQRLMLEARSDFEKVGKNFTYEGFIQYVKNTYKTYSQKGNFSSYQKDILRILEGDNLDKIEEAAKKKGLV